jgi:hypothetical protein
MYPVIIQQLGFKMSRSIVGWEASSAFRRGMLVGDDHYNRYTSNPSASGG